ncbi:amidase [Celeribacter halophilus]|uniref:amidase n=1 Tax=Celeribacter halophilus TaxID=576117 RepID=UPI003A90A801
MSRNTVIASLDKVDPDLGAFITLEKDRALEKERSAPEGRLSGLVVAVKDLIDTAGMRTTYGSEYFREHVPDTNADVVTELERQGAVILGKTNLNEFAYGVSGYNPHYGMIYNPKDRSRTAGGSSGGSAVAVATGVCRVAVGTDTSGSVRLPAACCGIYGIKLGRDAVSTKGIFPLAKSYDSLGYLAAGVEDLQLVLNHAELPDPSDIRVRTLGVDIEVPEFPADDHWAIFRKEVWDVHGSRFNSQPELYGTDVRLKLDLPFDNVAQSRDRMAVWRDMFLDQLEGTDVLVGPVYDGKAPRVAEVEEDYTENRFMYGNRMLRLTPIYNELGWVAMVAPTADGPIQIAGRPGSEAAVLAVGKQLGLASAETVAS